MCPLHCGMFFILVLQYFISHRNRILEPDGIFMMFSGISLPLISVNTLHSVAHFADISCHVPSQFCKGKLLVLVSSVLIGIFSSVNGLKVHHSCGDLQVKAGTLSGISVSGILNSGPTPKLVRVHPSGGENIHIHIYRYRYTYIYRYIYILLPIPRTTPNNTEHQL